MLRRIFQSLGLLATVTLLTLAGFLLFDKPQSLQRQAPSLSLKQEAGQTTSSLQSFRARDGATLSYRLYRANPYKVVVLLHGAAASSVDMGVLAIALQQCGQTVFVPDLRGHGSGHLHGDVAYIGQLDDDMSDFLASGAFGHEHAHRTLIGFSSGGGLALRFAGEPIGKAFDQVVLLSPFLGHDAPTVRNKPLTAKGEGPEWSTATGRIVALMLLNRLGVHRWDGLPVLSFGGPVNTASQDRTYSWRMLESFQPHDDFKADIRAVSAPLHVFVGADDERFFPQEFQRVFDMERKDVPVSVLSGLHHADMVTNPSAITAIVASVGTCDPSVH